MLRSSRTTTARSPLRSPASRVFARRSPRSERGLGLVGLLLLFLFVAQSTLWSVHGHAADREAGPSGFAAGAVAGSIGSADGETHSLASEPCSVCEMARRVGSEALTHAVAPELRLPPIPFRSVGSRPDRIPAPVEHARATPRAPPLAQV